MQGYGYLVLGPTWFHGGGSKLIAPWCWPSSRNRRRFTASATVNSHNNHYDVLGVPQNASFSDIKRAYRLLALKYHPDVNKVQGADEDFKSIRVAYEILIDQTTRNEYDKDLRHQHTTRPLTINREHEMQWEHYDNQHFYEDEERDSFMQVLSSAFLTLFLMQTVGIRLSLMFSSVVALFDRKLDAGYKLGYIISWILGGRTGILLTLLLLFATWVCGKRSSSVVALVVVAIWFASNLATYAPIPQGALLTLLYMSIKLHLHLT